MNFYCTFCDQRCHKLAWDDEWWQCTPCKVRFHEVTQDYQVFTVKLNDNVYEFHVGPRTTSITYLDIQNEYSAYEQRVFKMDTPIKGVTPQNAADKMKTLLTFS